MNPKYMLQMVNRMKQELEELEREQAVVVRQMMSQRLALKSKIEMFETQLRRQENGRNELIGSNA